MKLRLAAVLLPMLMTMTSAPAQQREEYKRNPAEPLPLEPIERFSGPLPATRNPALAGARVVFRHWNISNDQRVEIPHQGFLVVHLHAGEITVISGGGRREREGDEFWTVAPGEPLIVETGRDSVVLRTLDTIAAR